MNSLKAMYGCGLNFFIKLAYNSLFLYKFAVETKNTRNKIYDNINIHDCDCFRVRICMHSHREPY